MEKILSEILSQLNNLRAIVDSLDAKVNKLDTKVDKLDTKVDNLETKVDNLETKVNNLETKVNNLEIDVKGIKQEHGQILQAILESKEVQRGEIDILTHRTAKIEGTLKGAANQIVEELKEASNQ